jgi:hypothetical protein
MIQDTAWYNKPLLIKVMLLLNKCVQPEYTITNKLSVTALSLVCTPFLLRPKVEGFHDSDRLHMAAAAAGSATIEFVILHQSEVLNAVRFDLSQKQKILSDKCSRIRQIQEDLLIGLNFVFVETIDLHKQNLVVKLFDLLAKPEKLVAFSPIGIQNNEISSDLTELNFQSILSNIRWERCGLSTRDSIIPLQDFSSPNGLIALQSLVGFIERC